MAHTNIAFRVAGTWLAIASFLLVVALAFHGPVAPELDDQMNRIAGRVMRWTAVHWVAAAALSLYALTGLVVLTSGSRLTEGWWTLTAWAFLPVSALWTMTTAVAEATVMANAAASGAKETFEAWWAFAAGMATGFSFFALAIAVIAGNEARSPQRVTPAWSAWVGVGAGIASFSGWALGMWFGIGVGNLLWVASSIVMVLWILWFGVALTQPRASVAITGSRPAAAK